MKRMHLLPVNLLLVAMALAFVALASPVAAAPPCLGLGEYYSYAHQCTLGHEAERGWLSLLMLHGALVGATLGLVALRRHVLRLGLGMRRASGR
jgi:hypothetical protein